MNKPFHSELAAVEMACGSQSAQRASQQSMDKHSPAFSAALEHMQWVHYPPARDVLSVVPHNSPSLKPLDHDGD